MEYDYDNCNNSHPSLEPVVVIDDDDDEELDKEDPLSLENDKYAENIDLIRSIGPDISIIPIRKKPTFKIRLFEKEYSPSRDDSHLKVQSISDNLNSKLNVRLVSKEEAETAPDTYQKRKSLPLEKCPICKKFFRRMTTHLAKHEIVKRDPNDALTCQYCKKPFNTQSNLLIHIRTHTGHKPYICDICNKGFAQSCNLVNHMRVHSGEKPFKCPHCDRAFTQSGNLNNHIRLHTNEKPFQCHFCDKAFVQSGNLNSHIRNNHKYVGGLMDDSMNVSMVNNMSEMVN